jgi:hypothetical protein
MADDAQDHDHALQGEEEERRMSLLDLLRQVHPPPAPARRHPPSASLISQRAEQAGKRFQVRFSFDSLLIPLRVCLARCPFVPTPALQVHRAVVVLSLRPGTKETGKRSAAHACMQHGGGGCGGGGGGGGVLLTALQRRRRKCRLSWRSTGL